MFNRISGVILFLVVPCIFISGCHPKVIQEVRNAKSKKEATSVFAEFGISMPEGSENPSVLDFNAFPVTNTIKPDKGDKYAYSLPDYSILCKYNKSSEEVCASFIEAFHSAGYKVYRADLPVSWPGQSSVPVLIGLKDSAFIKLTMFGSPSPSNPTVMGVMNLTIDLFKHAGKDDLKIMERDNYRLIPE